MFSMNLKNCGYVDAVIKEVKAENYKICWSTPKNTLVKAGIVIACVVIVGTIVFLSDFLSNAGLQFLLRI